MSKKTIFQRFGLFFEHRVPVEWSKFSVAGGTVFVSRGVLKALDFPGDYSCPGHIL